MAQELIDRRSFDKEAMPAGEGGRGAASLIVPLIGSLFQSYGAVWLICGTPYAGSLAWTGLLRTASSFLVVTFAAHWTAIWVNRKLFSGLVDAPAGLLTVTIWPSVVWLPLLILLIREQSPWRAVLPGLIAGSTVTALDGWTGHRTWQAVDEWPVATLFHWTSPRSVPRTLFPALMCSLALHAAVIEAVRGELLSAGWLAAGCVAVLLWRSPRRPIRALPPVGWAVVPRTLFVFLLLIAALLPYVRSRRVAVDFASLLGMNPGADLLAKGKDRPLRHAQDGSHSGIILLFSAKRPERMAPPPPSPLAHAGSRERRPVVIPFDGAYWYFKLPGERPRWDAPVVRGDPRRKHVRSTDLRPLEMEAHQRLEAAVAMDCCSAIRLLLENADRGQGAIVLEVLLRGQSSTARGVVSLGRQTLPSSVRAPAVEGDSESLDTLSFPFPAESGRRRLRSFDEITVAIRPSLDRARVGPHVAIESFELVP